MARRKYRDDDEDETPKGKQYKEADLILKFNLKRIAEYKTLLMKEWLDVENPVFNVAEQYFFDIKQKEAINRLLAKVF